MDTDGSGSQQIKPDTPWPREVAKRFEEFLEFAPDAFVGIDDDGAIVIANAQTEQLFGYARHELVGKNVEVLVPVRFGDIHPHHRENYFADPRTRPMGLGLELYGVRKDGTEFPAEISLSSIATEEGVIAIAAVRDITDRVEAERERQKLEAELIRSRQLEAEREKHVLEAQLNQLRRLESVGQLAGGIAHDFNNLLGIILNYAQFVADELAPDSPLRQDVEEIRRAAERGAALTRQLLIFSRREVVRKQRLDLNSVVSELDKLLRRALGEHVELETDFQAELWGLEADPGQIEQVLVNLAVNARDAMPTGGRLMIQTKNTVVDDNYSETASDMPPGRYVTLTVSDTGKGMPRDVIERAIEPFYTTKPEGEGTGLGLTTVYGIVTEAGGTLHIYSETGLGTTVKVLLPASNSLPEATAEKTEQVAEDEGGGEIILVVEDEDSVRRLTERILAAAGYEVITASRGQLALDICRKADQPIDLLLTDVVMPEMLGPELVDAALKIRPGLNVLYMSGYIHQVVSHLGINQDELAFVEKPFTSSALLKGVRGALGEKKPVLDDQANLPPDPKRRISRKLEQ